MNFEVLGSLTLYFGYNIPVGYNIAASKNDMVQPKAKDK